MNERQGKLLKAIIDQFIATALPVGSHHIVEHRAFCDEFSVSCATIRNEMRFLGEEGFLEQPHVSAGRVPTAKAYRMYVKEQSEPSVHEKDVRKRFLTLKDQYFQRKEQERAYEAVALLSHLTPNVAFATVPHKPGVYYLGLANVLRQPEFKENPLLASNVVEVLEEHLNVVLDKLLIDDEVRYYIGEEHILPQFQSCSLMVTAYKVRDHRGVVGILGPMRMDYALNTVNLELVADLLRGS